MSLKCADRKNSSADANVCTLAIPADFQSIRSTSRHNVGHAHFCYLIFGACFAGKALALVTRGGTSSMPFDREDYSGLLEGSLEKRRQVPRFLTILVGRHCLGPSSLDPAAPKQG